MNEITNRNLLTAIILMGLLTIIVVIATHTRGNTGTYRIGTMLGANTYNARFDTNYTFGNETYQHYRYTPDSYQSSSTTTVPTTTTTTTYTYSYDYPGTYYGGQSSFVPTGYVPQGCENGTDYSTLTGEACG